MRWMYPTDVQLAAALATFERQSPDDPPVTVSLILTARGWSLAEEPTQAELGDLRITQVVTFGVNFRDLSRAMIHAARQSALEQA